MKTPQVPALPGMTPLGIPPRCEYAGCNKARPIAGKYCAAHRDDGGKPKTALRGAADEIIRLNERLDALRAENARLREMLLDLRLQYNPRKMQLGGAALKVSRAACEELDARVAELLSETAGAPPSGPEDEFPEHNPFGPARTPEQKGGAL